MNIVELNQKEITVVSGSGSLFNTSMPTWAEYATVGAAALTIGAIDVVAVSALFLVCLRRGWYKLSQADAVKVGNFAGVTLVQVTKDVMEKKKDK